MENIFHVILYELTKFLIVKFLIQLSDTHYSFELLGNMHNVIISFPVSDVINFEINISFLIKTLFCITEKVRTKI